MLFDKRVKLLAADGLDPKMERVNETLLTIADGRLDPGSAWYAIVVAGLLLVPLAVTTGWTACAIYLVSLCVGLLGNVVLRTGFFSWVTWAVSFALLPAYVSYGGWGGQAVGDGIAVRLVGLVLLAVGVLEPPGRVGVASTARRQEDRKSRSQPQRASAHPSTRRRV